jgi:hypothetical protein
MEDWSVLDLPSDPVPGDPVQLQTLAARLLREAEYAQQHASRLGQVAANSAALRMQGDYAPLFQQRLARLPRLAAGLGPAHESCGRALTAYAQSLEQAKIDSRVALSRGLEADARYKAALQQFCRLVPGFSYTGNWRELDEPFALRYTQNQRLEVRAAVARVGAYAAEAERERQDAVTMARKAAHGAAEAEKGCAIAIRAAVAKAVFESERAKDAPRTNAPLPELTPEKRAAHWQHLERVERRHPDEFDEIQRDPDKNGGISEPSKDEARVGLDLREQGRLPGDIQRPTQADRGEFYSPSAGKYYDIKGIHSDWPPFNNVRDKSRPFRGAYDPASNDRWVSKLTEQIVMKQRTVILDVRNANQAAIDDIKSIVERNGWEDNVIWYP